MSDYEYMQIGVIGHFGIGLNLANGQTIKTKIITEQLEKKYNGNVTKVDTHGGFKRIIPVILNTMKLIKNTDNVIIMVTENGLKVIVPILTLFNKKYKRTLHYIVIGGWLENFLKSNKSIKNKLKEFNYIYVETNTMKKQLENMSFNNVIVMPNCKELKIISKEELQQKEITEPLKLCTFSRVMKEKGIEDAVNAVININKKYNKIVYKLDIYGQIDSNQIKWFNNLKNSFPDYINYCGIIDYDKTTEVLKDYFLLLFPTYYEGEGLAGTLIDSFAAGVPAICSDWKYNSEIIEENKTGMIHKTRDIKNIVMKLDSALNSKNKIIEMKVNCLNKAKEYTIDNVMKILYEKIK